MERFFPLAVTRFETRIRPNTHSGSHAPPNRRKPDDLTGVQKGFGPHDQVFLWVSRLAERLRVSKQRFSRALSPRALRRSTCGRLMSGTHISAKAPRAGAVGGGVAADCVWQSGWHAAGRESCGFVIRAAKMSQSGQKSPFIIHGDAWYIRHAAASVRPRQTGRWGSLEGPASSTRTPRFGRLRIETKHPIDATDQAVIIAACQMAQPRRTGSSRN